MEIFAILFFIGVFIALLIPEKKAPPPSSGDLLLKGIKEVVKEIGCCGSSKKDAGGGVKKTKEKPPVKFIVASATGAALMSNFGASGPLLREISRQVITQEPSRAVQSSPSRSSSQSQRGQTNNPQTSSRRSGFPYNKTFSPEVERRLRQCIQANIVTLSRVPTLSGLLESLSWEREPEGEFERQVIFLYSRVQELRGVIEDCDFTLVQEILEAQERVNNDNPEETILVIGELVNVRVGPSSNNAVLAQVPFCTLLRIDLERTAALSQDQRLAIDQGMGWRPVVLADGRRGYIYSLYTGNSRVSPSNFGC